VAWFAKRPVLSEVEGSEVTTLMPQHGLQASHATPRSRIFARLHIRHQGELVMLILWRFLQDCSRLRCPRVEDP